MSDQALQTCMDRHLKHAAMVCRLDDELGTHHGLSWADFVLLTALDAECVAGPAKELALTLCMPASQLLLQLLPLEKIGLVERAADSNGKRRVTLRPQGRRLLREARDTAENLCALNSPRRPSIVQGADLGHADIRANVQPREVSFAAEHSAR